MSTLVTSTREEAAARFAELGWPTPRLEEWRYTNLAPVSSTTWREDDRELRDFETPATQAGRAAVELLFVNGRFVRQSGEVVGGRVASGEWRGGSVADAAALVALNAANARAGVTITIDRGSVVDGFIHLLFVGEGDGIWSHPRNVIDVGANAQVTIVETYVGSGRYYVNPVTELVAGDGAVVEHYTVICDSLEAFHTGTLAIRQSRASSVTARNATIGGALVRNDVHATLDGEGASLVLEGLFTPAGTQHHDNHTTIVHAKPHCDSLELYKGVLDGNGRGVFDGRIVVEKGAQKTVSRQSNHNLLLSDTAIVDSKPTLEILNDDVKCNHGSTIGQLDEESLFYLRSRGIDAADARNLLIYAFASEIVDRMKVEPVREQIRRALFQQMPDRLPERRETAR